uniref:CHD C-terminal 2 domain-containing protein n=1 Tax=Panagrolaimus sp. JU765 TaxID=591449 RepID=A0AC34RAM7_9BILA
IIEEQLRRAAHLQIHEKVEDTSQINKLFSDLDTIADSHQSLVKEAAAGNRSANQVLHKVLTQIEEILNEMKLDISRMPATLARLPTVTERLNMTERQILNRLTTKDPEAAAGQTPLPPPGPFVSMNQHQKFTGIQPKFAALHGDGSHVEEIKEKEPEPEIMVLEKKESTPKLETAKTNGTSETKTNGVESKEQTNGVVKHEAKENGDVHDDDQPMDLTDTKPDVSIKEESKLEPSKVEPVNDVMDVEMEPEVIAESS